MRDHFRGGIEGGPVIALSKFDGAAFDLDGVITRTATLHATAWKRLFDAFLARHARRTGEEVQPFSESDYRLYVDGKPRLDGIRDFLRSRGIALPEGTPDDAPGADTVYSLGTAKNALFLELLRKSGVKVFGGSIAFIRMARKAGLRTAVVSASENTVPILKAAGICELFEARVDGTDAKRLGLKGKPAPDTFLRATELLGVVPARTFGVEDSQAGIEAIRAAGFGLVIGVDRTGHGDALTARGADLVVHDLVEVQVDAKE